MNPNGNVPYTDGCCGIGPFDQVGPLYRWSLWVQGFWPCNFLSVYGDYVCVCVCQCMILNLHLSFGGASCGVGMGDGGGRSTKA